MPVQKFLELHYPREGSKKYGMQRAKILVVKKMTKDKIKSMGGFVGQHTSSTSESRIRVGANQEEF